MMVLWGAPKESTAWEGGAAASAMLGPRKYPWGQSIPCSGVRRGAGWGGWMPTAVPTLTFSTKVLSLSGISKGMVVRTSMMADSGMLTLGLEAWEKKKKNESKQTNKSNQSINNKKSSLNRIKPSRGRTQLSARQDSSSAHTLVTWGGGEIKKVQKKKALISLMCLITLSSFN